jgi:hypothetical protein
MFETRLICSCPSSSLPSLSLSLSLPNYTLDSLYLPRPTLPSCRPIAYRQNPVISGNFPVVYLSSIQPTTGRRNGIIDVAYTVSPIEKHGDDKKRVSSSTTTLWLSNLYGQ